MPTNAYTSGISGYTSKLLQDKFTSQYGVNATSYTFETFAAGEILVAAVERVASDAGTTYTSNAPANIFDAAFMRDFIANRTWSTILGMNIFIAP
jgi:hypothetical protein